MRWSAWGARRLLGVLGGFLGAAMVVWLSGLLAAGCDEMTRCSTCVDAADDAGPVDAPAADAPVDASPDAGVVDAPPYVADRLPQPSRPLASPAGP